MGASEAPRWNLDDLFSAPEDPRIEAAFEDVLRRAEAFAGAYKGRIASLGAADLAAALAEYESIGQQVAIPAAFASLRFAADAGEANGAFLQRVRERTTAATLPLLFFELELKAAEGIESLAGDAALAPYRHYLQVLRAQAPFRLSEPEERVLEEQANTGRRAFVRLFEQTTSNLRFTREGEDRPLTLSEILDLQSDPDREVRRASADALTAGLEPHARALAFIFNTLIQDKATEDRLRGHAYPEQARHLSNELTPEIVEQVVATAEAGYGLVARYYHAKGRVLGLDRLYHYDRYAPLAVDEETIPYAAARDRVLSAFDAFHSRFGEAGRAFFNGWIDAEPRPGKRGGAFCSYVTPDKHPYLFLNYLGKPGDVRTLAHELGHGVHAFLSRGQGYLQFHGTLPMAEVASTFAEMLVFEAAREESSPSSLLALYGHQIEQAMSTIFRQAALYRFEQAIHAERREQGELTVERLGDLWQQRVGAMFGDSVELLEGHRIWWSYVRHFVASPFYVYAYTFGEMLALALYRRFGEQGAAFAPGYVEMLAAGGSRSPQDLVAPLGVDLNDPAFWQGALDVLEAQVKTFEEMAAEAGA